MIGEGLISGIASAIKVSLLTVGGKAVARLFAYFGITMSVQKFVADPLITVVQSAFGGVPQDLMQWLSALGIDKAASILICALILSSTFGWLISRKTS